ncbi:hypothetical protein GCM10022377_00700 [Zhihengliuella alba]|uniref:Putative Flp pilus-assembly TadG-like N-terminal domain-containing protein n=1 Tax=Zhihengliuella alba TaxID=547018 RepID=A0ABP7CNG8_9MICC
MRCDHAAPVWRRLVADTSRPGEGEDGQTTVLIIGYVMIALLALSAMLAATSVNLEARRLQSVADSTADAAANGATTTSEGLSVGLSDGTVRARSSAFLGTIRAEGRFTGLRLESARASADGTTAYVRLTATVRPPIVGWITPWRIPIHASGDARTAMRQ